MNIVNSKSLVKYNTFKVNVTADFFANIQNEEEILALLNNQKFHHQEKLILGGGSNILFTKNISGLVIHNNIKGIKIQKETNDSVLLEIGAGELWDKLVQWTTENGLYGLENLSLIPGYVGAAPIQNIGAYGVELKDVFQKLTAINIKNRKTYIFNKSDCLFGYRNSIFKNELKNQFIITKIQIKLSKKHALNLSYKGLMKHIEKLHVSKLTNKDIRKIIIKIRNSKLPNPDAIGNAGSFFKNPIITKKLLHQLQNKYPEIPFFNSDKQIKIPAGWLIEKLNWKGYQNDTCGVYKKHSLVLVNYGNSTGNEIMMLARKIKEDVHENFNILLEEEVSIL